MMTNIERVISDMELTWHLLPIRRADDFDGVPEEGRRIDLPANDWPKQWRAGVDKCMGYTITWVGPFPAEEGDL